MRLPGSEKLEIIRLVEQSHLPARRTLQKLGIRLSTFYRWYDRHRAGGPEALEDRPSKPDRVSPSVKSYMILFDHSPLSLSAHGWSMHWVVDGGQVSAVKGRSMFAFASISRKR